MSNLVYSLIEGYEIPALINQIKEIMAENDAHNLPNFSEEMWRWQYQKLPTGKSYVYVVQSNNQIAGYYHVPIFEFVANGKKIQTAMVQDVAISTKLRGQGAFRNLAEFAHNHLITEGIEFAYTFPNHRSIHTFLKYNEYTKIATLPIYIKPLNSSALIRSKFKIPLLDKIGGAITDTIIRMRKIKTKANYELEVHSEIDPEIEEVYQKFLQNTPIRQNRNAKWLQWRFLEKPGIRHLVCSLRGKEGTVAVAIFKTDSILENNALLLMDFAVEPGKNHLLLQLIQEVIERRVEIFNIEINLVFTAGLHPIFQQLGRIGFLKMPKRIVPRELNLLVRNSSNELPKALSEKAENWHVTLADWDVF